MAIYQYGSLNTTALVVPDLYVQIVPPQNLLLNGVPTNVIGVVGTAAWGPVDQAVVIGTMADYAKMFGAIQARKYDMGTQVATAVQQGAQAFRCVRRTDGTDVAASFVVTSGTPMVTTTSRWTGSGGNGSSVVLSSGSAASTWKATVSGPMGVELFDNIPTFTAANSAAYGVFWNALAAAINNGTGVLRPASQNVVMAIGTPTTFTAPTVGQTLTLAGGSDGTTTITATVLVGADTGSRTGMYALRGQGCSIGVLADADDSTQWTTIDGFGLFEGIYMIQVLPSGTSSVAAAVTAKQTAGLDSYATKLMHGDWVYWNDPVAGTVRLVSPQGFVAGRLANLSPEQSSLNKPLYGVVGTQRSGAPGSPQFNKYSTAELAVLLGGGLDVIANPQPGGSYWGVRGGHNSSSNASVNGDNYTRMTNYIAATLNAGMGKYVGDLGTQTLLRRVRSTLLAFLQAMLGQGMLGSLDGSLPFSVVCDTTNNTPNRTALGYFQADIQVRYQAIVEKLILNMEGGQTVTVARQTLPSGQV